MYRLVNISCVEGVYNIASGESRNLKEFIIEIKNICKLKSELQFGVILYNNERVVSFKPILDKLRQNTGWSCNAKFKECIKSMQEFMNLIIDKEQSKK